MATSATPVRRPGDLISDRYRLIDHIGTGGQSVVWSARDEVLDRQVAVKMLAQPGSDRFRSQLRAEARAYGQLNTPRIAQVYDYGETENGAPYLVMEYVTGEPLSQRLASGRSMKWPDAVTMAAQIADALREAHARGLVHRDVKPDNVLLTAGGVKLVDFGICAMVGAPDADEDGKLLGTPAYLAPERIIDAPVHAAADVYGLGVLLYRALAGELPWPADSNTGLLKAHMFGEPAPLPRIDGLPPEVARLCTACVAKDPADRPTSAELADTLWLAMLASTASISPAPGFGPPNGARADRQVVASSGAAALPWAAANADHAPQKATWADRAPQKATWADRAPQKATWADRAPQAAASADRPRMGAASARGGSGEFARGTAAIAAAHEAPRGSAEMHKTMAFHLPAFASMGDRKDRGRRRVYARDDGAPRLRYASAVIAGTVAVSAALLGVAWGALSGGGRPAGQYAGASPCLANFTVDHDWGDGFVGHVTVTNASDVVLHGWQLTFAFPGDQSIRTAGMSESERSDSVTVTPSVGEPYAATIAQRGTSVVASSPASRTLAVSQSVRVPIEARYSGSNRVPSLIALNGTDCASPSRVGTSVVGPATTGTSTSSNQAGDQGGQGDQGDQRAKSHGDGGGHGDHGHHGNGDGGDGGD